MALRIWHRCLIVLTVLQALAVVRGGTVPARAQAPRRPAAGDILVAGQVLFEKRPVTDAGLQPTLLERPAIGVRVEVVDAVTRAVLASGPTGDTGHYGIAVPKGALNRRGLAYVRAMSETERHRVHHRATRAVYAVRSKQVRLRPNQVLTLNLRATDRSRAAGPFNILDTLRLGEAALAPMLTGTIGFEPRVIVEWDTRSAAGAFARTHTGTISLAGARGINSDEYDDSVILHEYGHVVAAKLSRDDTIAGEHNLGDRIDPRVAWSEGWATYFASAALGDPHYRDSGGGSDGFVIPLEDITYPGESPSYFSEFTVGSCLWHMSQAGGAGYLGLTIPFVFDVVHRALPQHSFVYLVDFCDSVAGRQPVPDDALRTFMAQYFPYQPGKVPSVDAPFPAPIRCGFEKTGGLNSITSPPGVTPRTGRGNLAESASLFGFQQARPRERVRVELEVRPPAESGAELELLLWDVNGRLVAEGDRRATLGASAVIDRELNQGYYAAEVRSYYYAYDSGNHYTSAQFRVKRSHPTRDGRTWDLGTLRTDDRGFVDESLGLALNGGGAFTAPQVVGAATGPDGIERAFRWGLDNETIEDLGLGPNARALGINDAETICGRLPSGGRMQAFTYSGGIFHTFTLPDADDQASSVANAINSGGTIVGTSQMRIRDPDNNNQIASGTFGFKGVPGGNLVRLPSLQPDVTSPLEDVGRSIAWGLNDAGVVVGESTTASGPSHAVVWPGTGLPTDLGTLAPGNVGRSVAYAINSVGRIVGAASTTADQDDVRACFWQNATPQLLTPNPPNHRNLTEARAINSAGLVVGWGSFAPAVPIQRALLWRQNAGQWEEIRLDNLVCPDEGWQLQVATGINNNGMITGYGTLKGEFTPRRAFLLELPASILLPPRSGRSRPGSLRRSR